MGFLVGLLLASILLVIRGYGLNYGKQRINIIPEHSSHL